MALIIALVDGPDPVADLPCGWLVSLFGDKLFGFGHAFGDAAGGDGSSEADPGGGAIIGGVEFSGDNVRVRRSDVVESLGADAGGRIADRSGCRLAAARRFG